MLNYNNVTTSSCAQVIVQKIFRAKGLWYGLEYVVCIIVWKFSKIDHFTVACLVAWPLNESEAGGDIVLIETFLLFLC